MDGPSRKDLWYAKSITYRKIGYKKCERDKDVYPDPTVDPTKYHTNLCEREDRKQVLGNDRKYIDDPKERFQ